MDKQVTPEGREWSVSEGTKSKDDVYPQKDRHTWGEFAVLAIEMGGYNDISAVDPYTGRRFWLGSAMRCDAHSTMLTNAKPGEEAMAVYKLTHECEDCHASVFTAIRRLLDAMEAAGFPDSFRVERDDPADNTTATP